MADYDSNLIKPLEGLQRITGLTPAKQREERKRKQQFNKENNSKDEQKVDESNQLQDMDNASQQWTENTGNLDSENNGIDFCA